VQREEKMKTGKFKTIAELVEFCKGMKLGDEGDFEYMGDLKNAPDTHDVQNALNDALGKSAEGIYFQCRVFRPPVYAVRCYNPSRGWDKRIL
jgi:hypothetical protein